MIDHNILNGLARIGAIACLACQAVQVGSPFNKGSLVIDVVAVGAAAVRIHLLVDATIGITQTTTHPSINFFGALQILLIARGIVEVAGHADGGVVREPGLLLLLDTPPDATTEFLVPAAVVHEIPAPFSLLQETRFVSDQITPDVGQASPQQVIVVFVPSPIGQFTCLRIATLGSTIARTAILSREGIHQDDQRLLPEIEFVLRRERLAVVSVLVLAVAAVEEVGLVEIIVGEVGQLIA